MELEKLGRSYVKIPNVYKGGTYITFHNFVERWYKSYYCYLCVYLVGSPGTKDFWKSVTEVLGLQVRQYWKQGRRTLKQCRETWITSGIISICTKFGSPGTQDFTTKLRKNFQVQNSPHLPLSPTLLRFLTHFPPPPLLPSSSSSQVGFWNKTLDPQS